VQSLRTVNAARVRCVLLLVLTLSGWLMLPTGSVFAASTEQETLRRLAELRALPANATPEQLRQHNEDMDDAWQFYHAHRDEAMPVLRRELTAELRRKQPAQLLLLDVASFLYLDGEDDDRKRALQALLAIDPDVPIIQANFDQLFRLTHALAGSGDPRLLAFIDRTFLPTERGVFMSDQSLTLNPTLICAFLYGLYGPEGERHLQPKLKDHNLTERVLEVLKWIGSSDSVAAVEAAMPGPSDYDFFARELTFMMVNGGPQGRAAMLRLDPTRLDAQSRQQYDKVRPAIEAQGYAQLRKKFDQFTGDQKLDDDALKQRLAAMYESYGKDSRLNPQALLDSGLPKGFLIDELSKIRTRMFSRIASETLSDIELTNAVLNTLRYRDR
jgi:hypothetical protein